MATVVLAAPAFGAPVQWMVNGLPVCAAPDCYGTAPKVCSDGAGGAVITWQSDYADIYVQRIRAGGTIAAGWPAGGAAASSAPGDQRAPLIAPDGQGGAFIAWFDYRDVLANDVDLYAQHVLGNGRIDAGWPADGLPVAVAPARQEISQLLPDGAGGLFLAWNDGVAGVYAQHLNADGTRVAGWPEGGDAVTTAQEPGYAPYLASDGEGGIIVVFGRSPNGTDSEVWAQRITWWGAIVPGWPINGKRVAPSGGYWAPTGVAPDGAGGAYVGWMHGYDSSFTDADVYAIRFLSDGSVSPGWATGGNPVGVGPDAQILTSVVADSLGGVMLGWFDLRGYPAVRAMVSRLRRDGTLAPGWQPNGNFVSDIPGYQSYPYLAPDGHGGAYVAFSDAWVEKGYVQRMSASGGLAPGWPTSGLALVNLDPARQDYPDITPDGLGGAIVSWEDVRSGVQDQIYAQRYFGDGPTPVMVSLVSAKALPDQVTLVWHRAEGALTDAIVQRKLEGEQWSPLGRASFDGTGRLEFVDRSVAPGVPYAYRVGWVDDGSEQWSPETWVDVPAALTLGLEGARPNPAVGDLNVALTLPRTDPATLALLDVSGRELTTREIGSLGAGRHLVRLNGGAPTPPGVYWLRLTQAGQSLVKRAVVVR